MNRWTRGLRASLGLRFKTANGFSLRHVFFGGGSSRRDDPPPKKTCRRLNPFAVLKRNPSEARSPRVHRFMESPYGKNLRAGGSYAHELSWQTSRESTVVGDCCGIGTGIDK